MNEHQRLEKRGKGRRSSAALGVFTWAVLAVAAAREPLDPGIDQLIATLGLQETTAPVSSRREWRPPRKILVQRVRADVIEYLQPAAPGVTLIAVETPAEAARALAGADAILGDSGFVCSPEVAAAGHRLRWIHSFYAGVEACAAQPQWSTRPVLITNMQRAVGPEMAEHVIAMLFALARGLHVYIAQQHGAQWDPRFSEASMQRLEGKTLLVIGLGGIGTEVARRAHALGMRVVATRASSREGPPFVSYVGGPQELPKLATEADAIVNTTPLTAATRGLFDAKFFASLKATAYFINVGRGQSVVQSALIDSLNSGRLAGAALDVTDPEPLPATDPLWSARNIIITPHVSGSSGVAEQTRWRIVRENLRRYAAGEKMLSAVDITRGY
jgi:phosphoglycerate dehydrogenase-like enzyme